MKFNQIRIAIIQREIETPRHGTLMHRLNVVNIEIEKKTIHSTNFHSTHKRDDSF